MNKKRAIAFILFLLMGVAGFLVVSSQIHIPVYRTVEGRMQGSHKVICQESLPHICEGSPVFLYISREESLKKIEKYEADKEQIVFTESMNFADGTSVKIDVQTGEVSLLWSVFRKGGAV